MNTELAQFSLAYTELHYVREGFTLIKERWYAWNYWAQHHGDFSLISWLAENSLEFSDIQAKTNYPNADIIRNREEGYKYYSAWRGAKKARSNERAFAYRRCQQFGSVPQILPFCFY